MIRYEMDGHGLQVLVPSVVWKFESSSGHKVNSLLGKELRKAAYPKTGGVTC